jgi:pantetheine-phosphate adenylyltransferase
MKIAVYPGTFDPPTFGHLDIIERASKLFDKLIIALGTNPSKKTLLSLDDRVSMMKTLTGVHTNVTVEVFNGLLVDFATQKGANAVVRGLRAISDFEYEFQMALMNRHLSNELETVFLMTSTEFLFVSSSIVKEVARLDGDISGFVPEIVASRLKEFINEQRT